ncbi:MAG: aspartate 1-decarboxylase [Phycisphaerae bacterium]
MLVKVLRAKIHRACITETHLDYEGSITIDGDLLDASGILAGEAVLVANVSNGTRHETYVLAGERGSGTVCLNGAAARLGEPGDLVIILAFAYLGPDELADHRPLKILVDERNRYVREMT